jgi:hypothetical protein
VLFPNSYTILFCKFYFLPFSVHVQTNIIYITLLSVFWWVFNNCINFFIIISSNFLFYCHILGLAFFYTLSFQNCLILSVSFC